MMPRKDLAAGWIEKAESDYAAAAYLLSNPERLREAIAFHCRQAAEKYLEAWLVSQGCDVPKTPRPDAPAEIDSEPGAGLADALAEIDVLTPYGVDIRYPGDTIEVLPGEERSLFALATQARDTILPLMGRH